MISNGDNDTYPVWVLQKAKNIRKDVTLLNISMLAEGTIKSRIHYAVKKISSYLKEYNPNYNEV